MSGEAAVFDLAAVHRFCKQKRARTIEGRVIDSSNEAQRAVIQFLYAEGLCEMDIFADECVCDRVFVNLRFLSFQAFEESIERIPVCRRTMRSMQALKNGSACNQRLSSNPVFIIM
ncbi:hypothetical protein AVEN_145761-1 [Araneus ventricosus]|uniref:Uncharacterized protein n=1 Tax=Araneus ventricosus TaxID=182803 RepID=A0A4Y2SPU3_ARAVE|nr:hypothetical protein AVEN_275283-1 [Araneus ventricosus]GBN90325.1 hypothetical protein AVEN_145761-1 [Araneus ventricosus]